MRNSFLLITIACCIASCTSHDIHAAKEVVTQADSLWQNGQMYGVDEGDSATLAQAYETLVQHSFVHCTSSFCTSYAHSCYHYGRLLRAKDNPVEAMQAFINATHLGAKDYHILGRIYSNMGDLCHLAGNFPLSYDMYEKSADMYLQNGDTLLYYYDLNNMAFELAMCADKDGTLTLIKKIEYECWDQGVQAKVNETKAELYLQILQYDSAIYYASLCAADATIGAIIKAQAFALSDNPDSSLCYANKVLADSNASYQDRFNAIYIVTRFDSTLCAREIAELSSQREDIRYYVYEPDNEKLSNAINLLKQDLERKPDLRWLYAVIITIFIIGLLALMYILKKRRLHQLLSQQVEDMRAKNNDIKQQHEQIVQEHTEYTNNLLSQIEQNCTILIQSEDFPNNLHLKEFDAMRKIVDTNFNMLASKLCHLGILNETEIRLCILVLLNANRDQISDILHYAKNGVGKLKYRVSRKMGIEGKSLRKSLITMAINESLEMK